MTRALAPRGDCPKCGEELAFTYDDPRYDIDRYTGADWLVWSCFRCHYGYMTRPADYVPREPKTLDPRPFANGPNNLRHSGVDS